MTRVTTESKVNIYEFMGEEVKSEFKPLLVRTHLNNDSRMVVIVIGEDEYTVSVADMYLAIKRSSG